MSIDIRDLCEDTNDRWFSKIDFVITGVNTKCEMFWMKYVIGYF